MKVSLIAAVAEDNIIAKSSGGLPWAKQLPADLSYFRGVTYGHSMIMGHTTYKEFAAPLPGRKHIVLTSKSLKSEPPFVAFVHSVDEALAEATGEAEVFVIGGANVFEQFIDRADKLYITEVKHKFSDGKKFPKIDKSKWQESSRRDFSKDKTNKYDFSFVTYVRE